MNTRERLKLFLASINISEGAFEKATGLAKGFVSKVGDSIRTSSLEKLNLFILVLIPLGFLPGKEICLPRKKKPQNK